MCEQGCSRLSMDDSARILDRLAGMEKIILPELAAQALANVGKQSTRRCSLTNEVMLWVSWRWDCLQSCRSGKSSRCRAGFAKERSHRHVQVFVWRASD